MSGASLRFRTFGGLLALAALVGANVAHGSVIQSSPSNTTAAGINTGTLNGGTNVGPYIPNRDTGIQDPSLDRSRNRGFSGTSPFSGSQKSPVWVEAGKLAGSLFGLFTENSFTDQLEVFLASLFISPLEKNSKKGKSASDEAGPLEQALAGLIGGPSSGIQGRVLYNCDPNARNRRNSTQEALNWADRQGS